MGLLITRQFAPSGRGMFVDIDRRQQNAVVQMIRDQETLRVSYCAPPDQPIWLSRVLYLSPTEVLVTTREGDGVPIPLSCHRRQFSLEASYPYNNQPGSWPSAIKLSAMRRRGTRYVMLTHLGDGRYALTVDWLTRRRELLIPGEVVLRRMPTHFRAALPSYLIECLGLAEGVSHAELIAPLGPGNSLSAGIVGAVNHLLVLARGVPKALQDPAFLGASISLTGLAIVFSGLLCRSLYPKQPI